MLPANPGNWLYSESTEPAEPVDLCGSADL